MLLEFESEKISRAKCMNRSEIVCTGTYFVTKKPCNFIFQSHKELRRTVAQWSGGASTGVDFSKILGGKTKILREQKVIKSDKCMCVSQLLGARARAAPKSQCLWEHLPYDQAYLYAFPLRLSTTRIRVPVQRQPSWGPPIKYVTLEGGGGPRRCDSLWQRERGQEHVTSRLYKFLSYIWNMKFKVMFNFLLLQVYCDRRRNGQKPTRQNPRIKTSANNWDRICTGDFCPGFLY